MAKVLHAIDIKSVVTYSLIGITIGLLLTFIPVSQLMGTIVVIVGLLMIITNGYKIYVAVTNKEESSNETLFNCLGALLGFILLVATNLVVIILSTIYLIGMPIYFMVKSNFDKSVMNKELPKTLLGVILLVSGLSTFDILFKIIGIVVLVCSLAYLGFNYFIYKKSGIKIIDKK